jgi:hypothetical protein
MLKEKSPYKQKNKIVLKALSSGKRSEPWHDIYSLQANYKDPVKVSLFPIKHPPK